MSLVHTLHLSKTLAGSCDPPDPWEPVLQPVKTPTPVVGHGFLRVEVWVGALWPLGYPSQSLERSGGWASKKVGVPNGEGTSVCWRPKMDGAKRWWCLLMSYFRDRAGVWCLHCTSYRTNMGLPTSHPVNSVSFCRLKVTWVTIKLLLWQIGTVASVLWEFNVHLYHYIWAIKPIHYTCHWFYNMCHWNYIYLPSELKYLPLKVQNLPLNV